MRPVTLKTRLIFVVVVALLPIGTLSVFQALSALHYSRALIGNRLITSALATAGQERDTLVIAKHTLMTLGETETVRSMGAFCGEALNAGMRGNAPFNNFARSDANGNVLCSVLPFEAPLSFAKDDWWQRGITQKGFTISAPMMGIITKRPVLIGMLPVTKSDGSNDGAITVAIDMKWLQSSLDKVVRQPGSTIAVVDSTQNTLLISGRSIRPTFNPQTANGRIEEAVDADGVTWVYSAAPLYDKSLYIVYAEPKHVVMATALAQVRIDLLLPILTILLASIALWTGTNRLVIRWLNGLRNLASQFAQGNYTGDLKRYEKAPQELRALSDDLHVMAHAIEARDKDLHAALIAKTVLTLDIHHRVKNNLQIVSSLLTLQSRRISDPAAKSALDQTRARIGALAQIHRLLYEESNDAEHGEVDIALLLNQLTIQLRALHRHQPNIDLICTVESHLVPVDTAVPISLFAVEAITNVYRHAFAAGESGSARVAYEVVDQQACLRVTDNGIGYGIGDHSASMGTQLMTAFAQQLGGTLDIAENTGGGTVVRLTYPMDNAEI